MRSCKSKAKRPGKVVSNTIWLFRVVLTSTLLFLFCFFPYASQAATTPQSLIDTGSFIITYDNHSLLEHNGKKLFVPASILKIATSLTALHILGSEYRFITQFYFDLNHNLYIRGGGDPFLVSEYVKDIGIELKKRGVTEINNLILDDTAYALDHPADGISQTANPYDAVNGALLVNFNSLALLIGKDKKVQSAEIQTPLLPLAREAGSHMVPGQYRINVSSLPGNSKLSPSLRYVGELFSAVFMEIGIRVTGTIHQGKVCSDCRLLYRYQSKKNVIDLVQANLKFSNNLIANQLFLACGAKTKGLPATWEKARATMLDFMQTHLKLDSKDILLVEGSGISRKNRVSAKALIAVLHHFKPYAHLLPLVKNTRIKSGTLSDVFSYAGYFGDQNRLDPFVIILNQKKNNRDQLLKILLSYYLSIKK